MNSSQASARSNNNLDNDIRMGVADTSTRGNLSLPRIENSSEETKPSGVTAHCLDESKTSDRTPVSSTMEIPSLSSKKRLRAVFEDVAVAPRSASNDARKRRALEPSTSEDEAYQHDTDDHCVPDSPTPLGLLFPEREKPEDLASAPRESRTKRMTRRLIISRGGYSLTSDAHVTVRNGTNDWFPVRANANGRLPGTQSAEKILTDDSNSSRGEAPDGEALCSTCHRPSSSAIGDSAQPNGDTKRRPKEEFSDEDEQDSHRERQRDEVARMASRNTTWMHSHFLQKSVAKSDLRSIGLSEMGERLAFLLGGKTPNSDR